MHYNKIEREDHLFAAFSYFDKDGSGYITQDELQQACDEFGIEDARLEEIIKEIDQDNVSGFQFSTTQSLLVYNSVEYRSSSNSFALVEEVNYLAFLSFLALCSFMSPAQEFPLLEGRPAPRLIGALITIVVFFLAHASLLAFYQP